MTDQIRWMADLQRLLAADGFVPATITQLMLYHGRGLTARQAADQITANGQARLAIQEERPLTDVDFEKWWETTGRTVSLRLSGKELVKHCLTLGMQYGHHQADAMLADVRTDPAAEMPVRTVVAAWMLQGLLASGALPEEPDGNHLVRRSVRFADQLLVELGTTEQRGSIPLRASTGPQS